MLPVSDPVEKNQAQVQSDFLRISTLVCRDTANLFVCVVICERGENGIY